MAKKKQLKSPEKRHKNLTRPTMDGGELLCSSNYSPIVVAMR